MILFVQKHHSSSLLSRWSIFLIKVQLTDVYMSCFYLFDCNVHTLQIISRRTRNKEMGKTNISTTYYFFQYPNLIYSRKKGWGYIPVFIIFETSNWSEMHLGEENLCSAACKVRALFFLNLLYRLVSTFYLSQWISVLRWGEYKANVTEIFFSTFNTCSIC